MSPAVQLPEHLRPLLQFGDDDSLRDIESGWRNYVAELGLTPGDVPALSTLVEQWRSRVAEESDVDDALAPLAVAWFAPIHAWRALGQLKAAAAVAPLLAQADELDGCVLGGAPVEAFPFARPRRLDPNRRAARTTAC